MNIAEETLRKYRIRLIEQEKSTHTIENICAISSPSSLFWLTWNRRFQKCR